MKSAKQTSNYAETFTETGLGDAAGLLWLASLITGEPASALDAVLESLDGDEEANPLFSRWMMTWARKLVIVRALGNVADELAESRRRLELIANGRLPKPKQLPPLRGARALDKLQLQRALEAIEIFPRCVLLLTIFERLPMEDAVILLDAGKETISTAQAMALTELAVNLTLEQGWGHETSVPQQPILEGVCPTF